MGVFNSADSLPATLDSVLSQAGIELELIAIDDGSTDDSGRILSSYAARDPRLVVLRQENRGLTASLIRGCAIAKGEFIARQDAGGDLSFPGRFAHQVAWLRSQPETVMTACGAQILGPEGEPLYEIRQSGRELHDQLRATSLEGLRGPSHHGAVMFRKCAYARVGGYRSHFRVAQDLDLWSRMVEIGLCLATPEILYEARLSKGSISHLSLKQQVRARRAIFMCAKARTAGCDESLILEGLRDIPTRSRGIVFERMQDARFYYFVGNLLRKREGQHANAYFRRALFRWPLHARAWFGFLRSLPPPSAGCSKRRNAA
jgi:glycosyltransferase involved in cell wall biosynthesis